MSDLVGKVVHHGKFGYGVGWRSDKFHRMSVKFESGKEVGGFATTDLKLVDRDEFNSANVLEKLKAVGLDAYIDMRAEEAATHAKVDDIVINRNFFELAYKETKGLAKKGEELPAIVNKQMDLLENSELDNFSKEKISKRLSRMDSLDKIERYLNNSLMRYRKLDEEKSLLKLNIMLTDLINKFKE